MQTPTKRSSIRRLALPFSLALLTLASCAHQSGVTAEESTEQAEAEPAPHREARAEPFRFTDPSLNFSSAAPIAIPREDAPAGETVFYFELLALPFALLALVFLGVVVYVELRIRRARRRRAFSGPPPPIERPESESAA